MASSPVVRGARVVFAAFCLVCLFLALSGPIAAADAQPTWSSTFEGGDFSEWSHWGEGQRDSYPVSRVVDPAQEGIPTRQGGKVARFEVSDGDAAAGRIHAKVYKWWNTEDAGVSGTYRAWYYVPRGYGWRENSWGTNIFQWKEEYTGPGGELRQEPRWALALGPSQWYGMDELPAGTPVLTTWNGANERTGAARAFPQDRWVEIRAEVRRGDRIDFYLDGELFDTAKASQYPVGPAQGSRSLKWIFGVGNYGYVKGPLYVDDVSYTKS